MRTLAPDETNLRNIVQTIRDLGNGGTNATGSCELVATAATQTVVADPNCLPTSRALLTPTSAGAASSGWWLEAVAEGTFTIGHAASATAGRTFIYEIRKP